MQNIRVLLLSFFITHLLLLSPAISDESREINMEPVNIQVAREALNEETLPSSITVITRKQIEEKKYINVEDMLREELGLDVVQNGPLGTNTTVFMRGTGSSSTLVLIDGVQVNSNTTGSFNFANILSDNLERVEIIRGPQSTLWGADAVGGVINLVTKRGESKPTHSFSFEGGSYRTFKETLSSSGGNETADYSLTATRLDSEGFSAASEIRGAKEEDGYQNSSVSLRTGMNFLEDGRIDFIGRYIHSRVEFDNSRFGRPIDGPPFTRGQSFYIALPVEMSMTSWWRMKFNPNMAYDEVRSRNTTFGNSDIFNRTHTLDLQNTFNFADYYTVIVGGEYQARNGANNSNMFNKHISNRSTYVQGIFNYNDKIVLTGGFRYDDNDPFKDVLTHKFEGAYRFGWGTRILGTHATGFRAPTINDLFFPNFSNPNLVPEENESWEVGLDHAFCDGKLTVRSVYFDQDITNLIQFDLATRMPQNIARAKSKGIETSLKAKLPHNFTFNANHTWNDAFNKSTNVRLRRRAEHKFHANLQHNWKNKLSTLLGVTYKSDTEDGRNSTPEYSVWRTAIIYKLDKHWKVSVRGENIFNEEYEEIFGFGTQGASAYAGFTFTY